MKHIRKQREPRSLTAYRSIADKTSFTLYEDYREKDDLRSQLLIEQGYICCYCMQRITGEHNMKIEHWSPQSIYNGSDGKFDRRIDYQNLLAACKGNEGGLSGQQHCDTNKGNTEIKINPAQANCEQQIYYSTSGEILSDDPEINHDLNVTLNLNLETLRKNRKAVLDGVIDRLIRLFPKGDWSKTVLEKEFKKLQQLDSQGYHKEYFAFAAFNLKKRLARTK